MMMMMVNTGDEKEEKSSMVHSYPPHSFSLPVSTTIKKNVTKKQSNYANVTEQ